MPTGMKKKKETVEGEEQIGGNDEEVDEQFARMANKILVGV